MNNFIKCSSKVLRVYDAACLLLTHAFLRAVDVARGTKGGHIYRFRQCRCFLAAARRAPSCARRKAGFGFHTFEPNTICRRLFWQGWGFAGSLAPDAAETIYTHALTCFAIAVAIDATIYTTYCVFTTSTKVTFVACALARFLCAYTTLTTIVRAALFTAVGAFPQIITVTLGLDAHSVPRAIVQAVLAATRVARPPRGAFTATALAAKSHAAALLALLPEGACSFSAVFAEKRWVANTSGLFIAHPVAVAPVGARGFPAVHADVILRALAFSGRFVTFSIFPVAIVRA